MFKFTSQFIPRDIFVIGGGGTGSRLIPMLSQFIRSVTRGANAMGWLESPRIWIVDPDIVESKNLIRQNFAKPDIGKYKAQVLAERYSRAYDTKIYPILEWVTSEPDQVQKIANAVEDYLLIEQSQESSGSVMANAVVISCVDSVKARRGIWNTFAGIHGGYNSAEQTPLYIDAGNEDSFGQVTFFNPVVLNNKNQWEQSEVHKHVPKMVTSIHDVGCIPMPLEYYLNMEDTVSTASCADLVQTLAINAIMATTIMGVVQNYFYRKPMSYNSVSLSLDGGNLTTYNTYQNMVRVGINHNDLNQQFNADSNNTMRVKEKDGTESLMRCISRMPIVSVERYVKPVVVGIEEEIKRKAEAAEREKQLARLNEIRAEREIRLAAAAERERIRAEALRAEQDAIAAVNVKSQTAALKQRLLEKRGPSKVKAVVLKDGELVATETINVSDVVAVQTTAAPELIAVAKTKTPAKPKRKVKVLEVPNTLPSIPLAS